MAYIGNQPGTGVRSRFIYTATALPDHVHRGG